MAEKKLDVVVGVVNKVRSGMAGVETDLGASLKRLKGTFGEDSTLGMGLKTLQGAGAAAALNLVGQMAAQATGKMVELRKELDAGAISAGEMAEKLAASLPIIGGIWQTGRNLRELATGEQAAADRIKRDAESTNAYIEARAKLFALSKRNAEDLLKTMREMGQQAMLLSLPEGQREAQAAKFAGENKAAAIKDEYEKKRQELKASADAALAASGGEELAARNAIPEPRYANSRKMAAGEAANQLEIDEAKRIHRAKEGELRSLKKTQAEDAKALDDAEQKALAENAKASADALKDVQRKTAETRAKDRRSADDRIAADEAVVRQDRLRRWKQDLDAEVDAVRTELAKREAEITQRRDETLKGLGEGNDPTGAGRQQVKDQAERELRAARDRAGSAEDNARAADADRRTAAAAAEQEREKQSQARQQEIGRSIKSIGIAYAEQEAAAGRISKLEVDRLRIAEEYNQKRRELQAIMADEATSLEQRGEAMRQFQGLDRQEAEAKQRAAADGPNRFAAASESARGTGAGALAREQALTKANKLEQLNVEHNRHLADTKELLRQGFDAMKGLAGQLITAFTTNSYSGTGY